MIENITEKLNELKTLDQEKKDFRIERQARIDEAIPDEIKEKLAKIEEYYKPVLDNLDNLAGYIEHEIKSAVLDNGASVKGKGTYHAIYVKGRATWDGKKLDGYALAHPEVNNMRKIGKPSVRIKR